jgi:hypothetical protein
MQPENYVPDPKVKAKWIKRSPILERIFRRGLEELENRDQEDLEQERTAKELQRGVDGKSVKPKYIVGYLGIFEEKRDKLKKKIKAQKDKDKRAKLRKELASLEKAVVAVKQAEKEGRAD